jgi:hypothetical protein
MVALREEADRLGEESETIFGVRNVGYFSLDKDLTGLTWLSNQIKGAAASKSAKEKRAILSMVAGYEDPGEGGFYDDAGRKGRQPHLLKGDSYDASAMLDPSNRPSQNTITYNLEDKVGIVFRYTGLDPAASYKVRVTMVSPRIPRQLLDLPTEMRRTQSVLADGQYLAKDVEIPEYTARQFEYDVPKTLTQDGALELSFERGTGSIATVVSEVWLIRK